MTFASLRALERRPRGRSSRRITTDWIIMEETWDMLNRSRSISFILQTIYDRNYANPVWNREGNTSTNIDVYLCKTKKIIQNQVYRPKAWRPCHNNRPKRRREGTSWPRSIFAHPVNFACFIYIMSMLYIGTEREVCHKFTFTNVNANTIRGGTGHTEAGSTHPSDMVLGYTSQVFLNKRLSCKYDVLH